MYMTIITTWYRNGTLLCISTWGAMGCFSFVLTVHPQVSSNENPKALNGLLNLTQDGILTNSQTSLSEILQEKEKKWGGGGGIGTMDHSALIPLRSKNFREKSDAHFVEVIKEDR